MSQTDRPNNAIRILAADDEESFIELYEAVLGDEADEEEAELSSELDQLTDNLFGPSPSTATDRVFDLTVCDQGEQAVQAVQAALEENRPYAVAFLDVRMPPGMDGIRTAEQIRKLDPYIEFVIVTAYADMHPLDISRRIPPEDKLLYVQKPFHPQEIHQFASALSSKWISARELRTIHTQLEKRIQERTAELARTNLALERDIQRRIKVEKERGRLIAAIEQLSECVIITDRRGVIQYLNPAFENFTGDTFKQAQGKPVRDYFTQDAMLFNKMCNLLQNGLAWSGNIKNPGPSRENAPTDLYVTVSPIFDEDQNIINYIAVLRDVTKEISLERRLQEIRKMEAVGTLADGVAHDFNNILGGIIGYTEVAHLVADQPGKVEKNLNGILQACYRAKDLIKQIMAFSRQEKGGFKPIRIQTIIEEVYNLIEVTLPSNIRMHTSVETDDCMVKGDPTQLHQVLMNLCTNAVHSMSPQGGSLEIALVKITMNADALAMYPDMHAGLYIRLSVKDTGCGIPAETQEHIFEPYFSTKPKDKGSGLGLAVVGGIIKNHGGLITVNSQKDRGTQFDIYLPEITSKQAQITAEMTDDLPRGDEHILFVDDEIIIAKNSAKLLTHLGYRVTIRTSSIEALELFKADPDRFDLVITDQEMPNKSGAVLAIDLMLVRPDIPIIICSGFTGRISEERAKTLGIREVAYKPLVISELARMIRRVLDN